MDPVSLPLLLDVIDQLAVCSEPLSAATLSRRRTVTPKRFGEVSRVLEHIGVAHRQQCTLVPDRLLERFVDDWEGGDSARIGQWLLRYPPYQAFLELLERDKCIESPPRADSEGRHRVGRYVKEKAGLNFVAVDTFKWWGLVVGQAYLSHIGTRSVYWGGGTPPLVRVEAAIRSHYYAMRPLDGFVNVGQLADLVCRELYLSFVRFEEYAGQLIRSHPERYVSSTSLARHPTTRSVVQSLLPRSLAKQTSESLYPGKPIEWTSKRFMQHGIIVGGSNVKLIRIQEAAQ